MSTKAVGPIGGMQLCRFRLIVVVKEEVGRRLGSFFTKRLSTADPSYKPSGLR